MSASETGPWQPDNLAEALLEYERALDEGRPLDRRALLAKFPDLADQLGPLLDAAERVEALARPLRAALGGPPSRSFPEPEGYELLTVIGHGGMGVVYKARQKGTEQLVALKMLHPGWVGRLDEDSRREAFELFRREARAAARLRHPNRVRILHLGEHQGRPFYVMELIHGCSLAEKARRSGGVSKADAVKYLASVAEAVHEAHQQKIIHRDIKPHNILIDEASDEALLADFGLARMGPLSTDEPAGAEGALVQAGTLPYMPPEQIDDADSAREASDVYSLGATLYELLTGAPPFQAGSRQQLEDKVHHEEPAPPRQRKPNVSRGIEQTCLKCLRKKPEERYSSALELAQALRRYLFEVRHARHFTSMGALFIGLGPVVLLINLVVFLLLRAHFYEPVIWATIFSMYPALFSVFLLAPPSVAGQEHYLSRLELWSIWGGKMFAAVSISIALRMAFPQEPERAMVLAYPVFAALSGMAVFVQVCKMERKLYALAVWCWGAGIAMVFHLEWAPLIYGACATAGVVVFGLYLRRLGKELR
jgi:hypothetical protein